MNFTHSLLLHLADAIQIVSIATIVLYSPFSYSWRAAVVVPFLMAFLWSCLRIVTIFFFIEPDVPPMLGFVVLPFFVIVLAGITRGIKTILFLLPALTRLEARILAERSSKKQIIACQASAKITPPRTEGL